MNIFSTDYILFSLGGIGVSLLELLSVIIGLTNVFLAGRGKSINYWFGYLYALLLFFLFMQKHLYSSMLLQPISLTIAIFGHYRWTHPRLNEANEKKELKISIMKSRERVSFIAIIVAFTVLWGFFVTWSGKMFPDLFPSATRPFLDALVLGLMLVAQYLSAQKKLDCWAVWLIVNTTNIILYLFAGLIFMPIVSGVYLLLAFFGFASWKKQWRAQNDAIN